MNIEWAKLILLPFVYLVVVVIAVFLSWYFRSGLRQLLTSLGIKSLKVAGVEISMSSEEICNAQERRRNEKRTGEADVEKGNELAVFADIVAPYIVGSRILWVDDKPLLNIKERRAFRLLGIEIENCLNTSEAVEKLCRDDYDLVISDIGRGNIPVSNPCNTSDGIRQARTEGDDGWKTLSEINRVHVRDNLPVIFYHGTPAEEEERDKKARAEGAIGATTSPAILYRWVLSVLLLKFATRDAESRHLLLLIPRKVRRRLTSAT